MLFVLTAAGQQSLANGKTRGTGYFLNEFYDAFASVRDAGHPIAIATPEGRPAVVDPESLDPKYWGEQPERLAEARALAETLPSIQRPLSLAEARAQASQWDALVVPGGQGVMIDLLDDPDLHALLVELGHEQRPVGLICHAPALLTRIAREDDPFVGRRVTSVSGFEEWYIETFIMKGRALERRIGRQLRRRGYRHVAAGPGRAHAVRDGNLVTSQNPFSGQAFSQRFIAALDDWRRTPGRLPSSA